MFFSFRKLSIPVACVGLLTLLLVQNPFRGTPARQGQSTWDDDFARLQTVLADNDLPDDALVNLLSDNCVRGLQPDLFEIYGYSRETWAQVSYQLDVEEDLDLFFNQLCFITQYEWVYMTANDTDQIPDDLVYTLIDRLENADAEMDVNAFVQYLMEDLGLSEDHYPILRNVVDTLNLLDVYDPTAQEFDNMLDEQRLTDAQYFKLDLANTFRTHGVVLASYERQRSAYLEVQKRLQGSGMEEYAATKNLDTMMDTQNMGDEAMAKAPCIFEQYKTVFEDMVKGLNMTDQEFGNFMVELRDTGMLEDYFGSIIAPEHMSFLTGFVDEMAGGNADEFMQGVDEAAQDEDNPFGQFEYKEDEWCTDADGDGNCDDIAVCDDADGDGSCDDPTCTDADGDGYCDAAICTDEDYDGYCDQSTTCIDEDQDGYCDPDATCEDADGDGYCDEDYSGGECVDADGDGYCDEGGGECVDADGDGYCDEGGGECVDADGDGYCDEGGGECVDADGDGYCDEDYSSECVDADGDGYCDEDYSGGGSDCTDANGDGYCDEDYSGGGSDCTDADGDGYCDDTSGGGGGSDCTDADGDGYCDDTSGGGGGSDCTDADGDGYCDDTSGGGGGSDCTDANGDGYCDDTSGGGGEGTDTGGGEYTDDGSGADTGGGDCVDADGDGYCDQ